MNSLNYLIGFIKDICVIVRQNTFTKCPHRPAAVKQHIWYT